MRIYNSIRFLPPFLALFFPFLLHAQEQDGGPLEEIIVTPSRLPVPARRIATSVTVMTADDIAAHGNLSLTDVLRQTPAVAASGYGGAGKATVLRIRGEEGFRTLVMFDGIRLLDPSIPQVGPQFEHVMSSGVGRLEVLRGPQGLGYGADAGGVIAISSPRVTAPLQLNLDAQGGRFHTRRVTGDVAAGGDRADVFIAVADLDTAGFNAQAADTAADADGYDNTTLHARAGVNLGSGWRLDVIHRHVDGATRFDGCFAATLVHDCSADYTLKASRLALAYSGDGFSHGLAWAGTRTDRANYARGDFSFGARGDLERLEYTGSLTALPGVDLAFGADLEEALNDGTGRDNRGAYLEILSDFSPSLFLSAGLRHDDNDDFGTQVSHRVSAAWLADIEPGGTLKIRGSYGTGFRAPSPYEIAYNAGAFAFPPASLVTLQQEESAGYELALEYVQGSTLSLEAVWFDQDVENALYFDLSGFSGYLQDTGASYSRGVELSGRYHIGSAWQLAANYTWNETKRPNGMPRPRRPEHLVNAGLSWSGLAGRVGINAFYRISADAVDDVFGTAVGLDDFGVLDFGASYQLTDAFQLYVRVENALDERYEEVTGYFTPGAAAYIGFRLALTGL